MNSIDVREAGVRSSFSSFPTTAHPMLSSTESGYTEALDFCVGVDRSTSRSTDSLSSARSIEKAEPPMAFWRKTTYELLSFNEAFAALVEYTPSLLLADFHYSLLDRYGQLNPTIITMPGTMAWTLETGRKRPKRVMLTIIPLADQILWMPRDSIDVQAAPSQSPPMRRALPARPPSEAPSTQQRELIRVRSSTKRPWDDAVVKFSLRAPAAPAAAAAAGRDKKRSVEG